MKRRAFQSTFVVGILLLSLLTVGVRYASAETNVRAVESMGITVSDMERSLAFYGGVLTFEKVSDTEVAGASYERLMGVFGLRLRVVRLRLGDEFIELIQYLTPRGRPIPVDSRSNDRWFQHIAIIVSDMDKAYRRLRDHNVEHASTGPQTLPDWNLNAGGIKAFYFKDPDGNVLEILAFPPGKGDRKWHKPTDRLFLGIDHTAIVIWDTDASLRFYRDTIGLKIVGESENYGPEQEHLNNVFGARLRITTLKAAEGPGIELLEYLAPRNGRPYPPDSMANDLWHWQTNLRALNLNMAAKAIRAQKYGLVSPGVITLPNDRIGFSKGLMVRDPDGHAMVLVEK